MQLLLLRRATRKIFYYLDLRFFYIVILFVFILFSWELYQKINISGGIFNLYKYQMVHRFSPYAIERTLVMSILSVFRLPSIFLILTTVGFYYREKLKWKYLFTFVFPVLIIFNAALSGYRGTVIFSIFPFIIVEYRRRLNRLVGYKFLITRQNVYSLIRKMILPIGIIVCLFVLYGYERNKIVSDYWNSNIERKTFNVANLFRGSGFIGLTSIVSEYGNNLVFLFGKTYADMALLPIPRAIYINKPKWYGIDDITRNMGWPESTMSAVTLPGEAYANFALYGILIGFIFGIIFFILFVDKIESNNRKFVLFACLGLPLLFTSNWMAFTGFVNHMVGYIVGYLILIIVIKKKKFRIDSSYNFRKDTKIL